MKLAGLQCSQLTVNSHSADKCSDVNLSLTPSPHLDPLSDSMIGRWQETPVTWEESISICTVHDQCFYQSGGSAGGSTVDR